MKRDVSSRRVTPASTLSSTRTEAKPQSLQTESFTRTAKPHDGLCNEKFNFTSFWKLIFLLDSIILLFLVWLWFYLNPHLWH